MFIYCVNCNGKFWSEGPELCSRCITVCADEHEANRERAEIEADEARAAAIAEWMDIEEHES